MVSVRAKNIDDCLQSCMLCLFSVVLSRARNIIFYILCYALRVVVMCGCVMIPGLACMILFLSCVRA